MKNPNEQIILDFQKFLDSEEGQKLINDCKEKQNQENIRRSKWLNKFNLLSPIDRSNFIKKVVEKYSSDKYRDKWILQCKFPPEYLYNQLWEYAAEYGFEFYPIDGEQFCLESKKVIDDNWVILLYENQQSIIRIRPITDEDRERGPYPFKQSLFRHEYDEDWINSEDGKIYYDWCYNWANAYRNNWVRRKQINENFIKSIQELK